MDTTCRLVNLPRFSARIDFNRECVASISCVRPVTHEATVVSSASPSKKSTLAR
jgi:hypothetical protein